MQNITDSRNTVHLTLDEIMDTFNSVGILSDEDFHDLNTFVRRKKFSGERLISKCIEAFHILGASVSRSQLGKFYRDDLTILVWDVFERDAKGILAGA